MLILMMCLLHSNFIAFTESIYNISASFPPDLNINGNLIKNGEKCK